MTAAAVTAPRYFTCQSCGLEFETARAAGSKPDRCDECKPIHDQRLRLLRTDQRRRQRAESGNDGSGVVLLPDGHPVLPILSRWADHECGVRLAVLALNRGDIATARQALIGCQS